jgi:ribosomal protein S12 methylthiotransferase accessory factor
MTVTTSGKLRFKAHLIAAVAAPDTVLILGEEQGHVVRGIADVAVAAYLDGRRSAEEILEAVADQVPLTEAYLALSRLRERGFITDTGTADTDVGVLAGWEAKGLSPQEARSRLGARTVLLVAFGSVGSAVNQTVEVMERAGARARVTTPDGDLGDPNDLVVALADNYLDPALGALNARMLTADRSWLLVKPRGLEVWVGPYIRPGRTGCWECLRERLDRNRPMEQFLRWTTAGSEPLTVPLAATSTSVGLAVQLAASVLTSQLLTGEFVAEGTLMTVHTTTLETEHHTLVRQPQCAACGDRKAARPSGEIKLSSDSARRNEENGWRVMPPEATLSRLGKHVGRLLGAVGTVRSVSAQEQELIHSYQVAHGFSAAGSVEDLRQNIRGRSGGKGRTDGQAKVSGICEAIERYSGVWREGLPSKVASYDELGPDSAVEVNLLALFSERQFADRQRWNSTADRPQTVPAPLDPARPITWSTAWSLTNERERLVPAAYAWYGHPELVHGFVFPDSNGSAAGNTLEEAILQGFCELVERDSVALWWYNRLRRPGVDLDSFEDSYLREICAFYARQGREVWVLDITADLGIPTFAAVSRRVGGPTEDILLGFGSHLDPSIAVVRALTELNQFLPAVSVHETDGSTRYKADSPAMLSWWRNGTAAVNEWLLPHPEMPATTAGDFPDRRDMDLTGAIRHCVAVAEQAGLETIVLDQTRPDIELAVVKVMVPGLRHFWRRLGPGRLYDVPVRLGWNQVPTHEAEMNQVSLFF